MSFNYGVASANVSITGGVTSTFPVLGDNQTFICQNWSSNGSVQTVYTVTAGKKFALMGIMSLDAGTPIKEIYDDAGTFKILNLVQSDYEGTIFPFPIYIYDSTVKLKATNGYTMRIIGVEF